MDNTAGETLSTEEKRRVRTVPGTLPQAMQACGKGRPACAHCRPLHAPDSRRKQNLRHAVSGQGGKDVAKGPRDPQKDPGKEKAATRGSSHTAKGRATRGAQTCQYGGGCRAVQGRKFCGRHSSILGGQPRGFGHGRDSGKRSAKQRGGGKPMAVGSRGETFRHRKKSRSACRKARRTGESSSTNGGDTNCTTAGIPSHCCRTNAGMRCGRSRPTWPQFSRHRAWQTRGPQ